MTNGPHARVAESVRINIPRPRNRANIIEDPAYYKIRNYLVNFLVKRSGQLSGSAGQVGGATQEVDPSVEINPKNEQSAALKAAI